MYCESCRQERPPKTRYCTACGARLVARPLEDVTSELEKVRWLLAELERWDDVAPAPVKVALRRRYEAQERALVSVTHEAEATSSAEAVVASPVAPREVEATVQDDGAASEAGADGTPAVDVEAPRPASDAGEAPPPVPLEAHLPGVAAEAAALEPRRVAVRTGPSAWERLWKPLLGESIGWFIGAFLILAGTFTFVADAWATMSSTGRALTVFGLAVFWTLGFAGWAQMLTRREATRPASKVLFRIAAAVAPLATVALGPLAPTHLIVWPLLAVQAALAGLLALRAGREAWSSCDDVSRRRAEPLASAAAMAGATLVLGAAPLLAAGPFAWLELFPVALLAAVVWRFGPPDSVERATFSLAAVGYAVLLIAVRLHVAALAATGVGGWGGHAVALSAFAAVVLELFSGAGAGAGAVAGAGAAASRRPRAADAPSVLVVSGQTVLLWPAFFAEAPAFVVGALLAALTAGRLAFRRGPSPAAARWLVPAYVFGYVAFQRVDQLVPAVVVAWYERLKVLLGYASAPLPPSYASVYAALYVVALGLLAARWLGRGARDEGRRARADVLLGCTSGGALVFGALALGWLGRDARPALAALPLLTAAALGLGAWTGRTHLVRAGAVLVVGTGVALLAGLHAAWPAAALALVAALLSVPALREAREALSAAVMLLTAVVVAAALTGTSATGDAAALVLASAAALVVARNLDEAALLSLALVLPLLLVVRLGAPWMVPLVSLAFVAALPAEPPSRRVALFPAVVVGALGGPAWEVAQAHDWPSLTLALGGAALTWGGLRLGALGRSSWPHAAIAVGLVSLVAAAAPWSARLPWYEAWHAQALLAVAALGASVASLHWGRRWQTSWLAGWLVALAVAVAGSWEVAGDGQREALVRAALVTLLATPALWPVVTVPLASLLLLGALITAPLWLLLVAALLSVLALADEWEAGSRWLLDREKVAWPASLCAVVALAAAVGARADARLVVAAAALLPLAWTRATRQGAMLAAGLALAAASGWLEARTAPWGAAASWASVAAAALALVHGRLVLGTEAGRRLVGFVTPGPRLPLLAVATSAGVAWGLTGGAAEVSVAWVVAVVLVGGAGAPWSLAAAVSVALTAGAAALLVAWALMVLAALAHARPQVAEAVLGWRSTRETPALAAGGAVLLSAVAWVAHRAPLAAAALPLALLEAGALTGWWGPWMAAVVVAGLDLDAGSSLDLGSVDWLDPVPALAARALAVATAAAALAAALRRESVARTVRRGLAALGLAGPEPLARPWWWGSAALVLVSLFTASPWWLVPAALLLLTPSPLEASVGTALAAAVVLVVLPHPVASVLLGAAGAAACWLGALGGRGTSHAPVARVWFHAGWLLALVAVVVAGPQVRETVVPVTWALAALTGWGVAFGRRPLEWLGWGVSWLAGHVVVAHVGAVLATGAPEAAVLPYFALASALLATAASWRDAGQGRVVGLVLGAVAVAELGAALSLLSGAYAREALVAVVAGAVVLTGAARRAVRDDDEAAGWLAQAVVAVTVLASRRLVVGAAPGLVEAWAAMVWGTALWGLARFVAREGRPRVARALRWGAVAWPLVGLAAAPWTSPGSVVLLLLVASGHYAWLAGSGMRRVGAAVSALAFNGAMVAAFFATSWRSPADLALPAGLSVLALSYAFQRELGRDVQVKLRAVAMALVYVAASWRPLTFTSTWGLAFSLVVCVAGVAVGSLMRIRSFVLTGTVFLVTSVVATLVRQGLAEPRLGAVLLAALGLGVVGFMVALTTRRAELLARLAGLKEAMRRWEG